MALRQVMADRGMFATTDLIEPPLACGIHLSYSGTSRSGQSPASLTPLDTS